VSGPVVRPRVTVDADPTRSWLLELTLRAGEFVDVDTATGAVLLGGTGSRAETLRGDLAPLPPGSTAVTFTADIYNAAARLEVRHRDAYL
jgi:hypothetical protein